MPELRQEVNRYLSVLLTLVLLADTFGDLSLQEKVTSDSLAGSLAAQTPIEACQKVVENTAGIWTLFAGAPYHLSCWQTRSLISPREKLTCCSLAGSLAAQTPIEACQNHGRSLDAVCRCSLPLILLAETFGDLSPREKLTGGSLAGSLAAETPIAACQKVVRITADI